MNRLFYFIFFVPLLSCGEAEKPEEEKEVAEPTSCECNELILDEGYNHFYLKEKRKGFNGDCKAYYPGGKLKMEKHFEKGKVHGKVTEYWENGEVREVSEYRMNLPIGERIIYSPRGEVLFHATYKNGKQEEILVNKPNLLKQYGLLH